MKMVDSYRHDGEGYNPYLIAQGWQVAQLNHSEENRFYNINRMDVHHHTDEAFIMLNGTVVLIAARIVGEDVEFEPVLLKPGITYNIPAECWHNLMMSEDAAVLIVESANTHLGDFEYYNLTETQIDRLNSQVRQIIEG